jgi:hypothetical protein
MLPGNASNNLCVADFMSQFIGYTPSGITVTHNTSNLISHKPVTSSGFDLSWAGINYSWETSVANCCDNRPLTAFIASAINWSVRWHDICVFTDRYLVVTIPHCFGCQGYFAYRTVESNLVVSVAWQWLFSVLDNSAVQTTCHNIF